MIVSTYLLKLSNFVVILTKKQQKSNKLTKVLEICGVVM